MEDDRYTRITLRIPRELHALLQNAAKDTSKSVNAEIIGRLQDSFKFPLTSTSIEPKLPPDLFRHVAPIPEKISKEKLKEEAERHFLEMKKAFEAALVPPLKTILQEYKEQERRERQRLIEIALGAAQPFNKTKKPKA